VSAAIGVAALVLTHRLARRLIETWLARRRERSAIAAQASRR
jgi:hypothetical protein